MFVNDIVSVPQTSTWIERYADTPYEFMAVTVINLSIPVEVSILMYPVT